MTHRRSTRFLRGVASLVATIALLAGVPLLLITWVGWPLPTSIPSVDAIDVAARSGISDQVVVNTLAVIAWVAWAQLALALIVETVALARGRPAIHLPVLPGFQVTAARLVAGILMIASTIQPGRAHAAPPPIPVVVEAAAESAGPASHLVIRNLDHTGSPSTTEAAAPTTPAPAVDHPTVTVKRHDSYWAIAERTLGDGLRWREILDLNVGRTLPDGTTITAGDDTLHTAWVLLLPDDATGDPAPSGSAPTAEDDMSTVVVAQGDNLWTISEDRLEIDLRRDAADTEVAPYWHEVIDANEDRFVQPGNADLIHPGQVLLLPPTGYESAPQPPSEPDPAPPPADAAETPDPSLPPPSDEPTEAPTPTATTVVPLAESDSPSPVAEPDMDDHDNGSNLPAAAAIGGLSSLALAVGLKRLLDRRRRRFTNDHRGQVPGRTPPDQRELHQAVVAQADEERIDDLQGVLGRLAASLATMSVPRRPRMIRHSAHSLEVLLDEADTNAPAGWTSTDDGRVWTLAEIPDPEDAYDGPLCPAPLVVTIGQPDDDAQLYLDLEVDGLLALTGDQEIASNLARSIVTELTLSPLAETLRVIAVGDVVDPEAQVLEHLTVANSWESVTEDIQSWAAQSHGVLAENEWANAFVARGHEPDHDGLVPVAVIADRPPPDTLATLLREHLPSAVAVVVVGSFQAAAAAIRCEPDALNFDTVDLACSPQELEVDELAAMSRFLVAADSPDEQQLMEDLRAEYDATASPHSAGPASNETHRGADADDTPTLDEPPAYEVLVRLLGDITVEGGKALKPKATSVVAYLALHRSVSTERLEEACWFGSDGTSHRKRLRDTMTESRDALGSQHFPANRSGTYDVGSLVRTDLELFEWHLQHAADREPAQAVGHYRAALSLLTGKPFSYPNAARASYGWVDFEHHATTWDLRVTRVAQAFAELQLDLGEPGDAIATLRHALQAIPLNGALVETLMRAHIANDDRAGAERVYEEHAAALQQAKLGDPEDAIEQLRLDLQTK